MLLTLAIALAALGGFGVGFRMSSTYWARRTLRRLRADLELPAE